MGYLHIDNLYKNQSILIFKECYALEKIHGTSAHIGYNGSSQKLTFFSGGEKYERFVSLFDLDILERFFVSFGESNAVVYGEAYGGKQQGMSSTYGPNLKFVAFDVKVEDKWLVVPSAEAVCKSLGIEFVDYVKIATDIQTIDFERDKESIQAIRNGVGSGKKREGVVLRPTMELTMNNGSRFITKHKQPEFSETKTPREVSPEAFQVLEDARLIAEEWVTEMRLKHVLDKLPQGIGMEDTRMVITAMIEDIYREASGEIVESKEVSRAIGGKAARLFKKSVATIRK